MIYSRDQMRRNDALRRDLDSQHTELLELAELRRMADLSVDVWLDMTGGTYPAAGDEWGHLCWNRAKATGLLPITEADVEWDST